MRTAKAEPLFANPGFWCGVFLALFLLVGRWSLARLGGASAQTQPLLLEPREWLMAAIALLGLAVVAVSGRRRVALGEAGAAVARQAALALLPIGYLVLSAAWAPSLQLSGGKAYEVALVGLVLLTLAIAGRRLDSAAVRFGLWSTVLAVGLVLGAIGLASYSGAARLSVLGGGPNIFGRNMGLLCLACLFFMPRGRVALPWIAGCVVAGVLLVLSGSRGALMGGVVGVGLALALMRLGPKRWLAISSAGGLVIAVLMNVTHVGDAARGTFERRVLHATVDRGDSAGRDDIYRQALRVGMDHPVMGAGLGGFTALTGRNYPHNLFLEVFSEGGLVGLMLMLPMLAGLALGMWRIRGRICPATAGACVLLLVASQWSGDLFDSRGFFVFAALCVAPTRAGKGPPYQWKSHRASRTS